MYGHLDSRLPEQIWYNEEALAHEATFLDHMRAFAQMGTLWIFDRGFCDCTCFADLVEPGVAWTTRLKANAVYSVRQVWVHSANVCDQVILPGGTRPRRQPVRLIELPLVARGVAI